MRVGRRLRGETTHADLEVAGEHGRASSSARAGDEDVDLVEGGVREHRSLPNLDHHRDDPARFLEHRSLQHTRQYGVVESRWNESPSQLMNSTSTRSACTAATVDALTIVNVFVRAAAEHGDLATPRRTRSRR